MKIDYGLSDELFDSKFLQTWKKRKLETTRKYGDGVTQSLICVIRYNPQQWISRGYENRCE